MNQRSLKSLHSSPMAHGRRVVRLSASELVNIRPLREDCSLPVVISPVLDAMDLSSWASANLQTIDALLKKHGGILFRGFAMQGQPGFEQFLDAVHLERMHYIEGATPRTSLGHQVYTSTEFPPEHRIALHNELSYVLTWPMKISFFCIIPAESRGETPIADMRKVLRRIAPAIRQSFAGKGWMLVRNFGDGLGLPWQTAFRTESKDEVERYCAAAQIQWEWREGGRLRTRQVRPATATHPQTGEEVWFNHVAFWHSSSLDANTRQLLVSEFKEDGIPYNTYYGDGAPIEDAVIDELRRAYDGETVEFPWQKGDALYLDNMLVSHGRSPFTGSRKIIVGMGEPYTRTDL